MEKTRVGVIGLGGIAQLVHLPILTKMNNVSIEAVSEISKNKLKTVAGKFRVNNKFTDYKEMLSTNDLDAVIIATPTNTHLDITLDCLKAGKHVLLEKPGSRNLDEAKKIKHAAIKNNKLVMVGMNPRFRPDAMLLKSLLNSGELGEIFYLRCGWTKKQSSSEKWSLKKSAAGGGVVIDLGVPLLDLSLWLMDFPELKSITVQTYKHETKDVEDSAVGLIKFKNSAVINFEVSWSFHTEVDSFALTTFGTAGTAHLNPLRAYRRVDSSHIDYTPAQTSNVKNLYKKSYENELKHFIASIRGNTNVISSIDESLYIMKLLEGFYKSGKLNKEIVF